MDSVLQSDIFFFISSVSVIFITILIMVALFYVISILKSIHALTTSIKEGAQAVSEDLSQIRSKLSDKGVWMGLVMSIITMATGASKTMQKRNARKKKEND
jgi:sensor domain CHASE-containing protein